MPPAPVLKLIPAHGRPARRILLLHGWNQSMECWGAAAVRLNQRFHADVAMIDWAGHGWTPMPHTTRVMGGRLLVKQVRWALERLGWLEDPSLKITIGGCSLGGAMTMKYLSDYGDNDGQIDRAVFVATAGLPDGKWYVPTRFIGRFLSMLFPPGNDAELHDTSSPQDLVCHGEVRAFNASRFNVLQRAARELLAKIRIVRETPLYTVELAKVRQALPRLAHVGVAAGSFDFLHTPNEQLWRSIAAGDGTASARIEILTFPRDHVLVCSFVDSLRLDRHADWWVDASEMQRWPQQRSML